MKRQALSLISLVTLLLVAGSAFAQTIHVRANVPFNFTAAKETLPAGVYEITNAGPSNSGVLFLQAEDGKAMALGANAAVNSQCADKTKLVFHRYGTQYFLAEIWVEGAVRGRQVPKSSREKELAKNLTAQPAEIMASLR